MENNNLDVYLGGGNGSSGNPYTWDEYEYLADNGNWSGGYVEGAGYTGAQATIQGNSSVTSNFSSYSMPSTYFNWPNSGFSSYTINGYTVINNGQMNIGANIYNSSGQYPDSQTAFVEVYFNGSLYQTTPLTLSSSGYYSMPGTIVLGDANINLPIGGYVEVRVRSSGIFSQYQTGVGNVGMNTNDLVYSGFR
ncbi:MAG: hypothetical protein LBG80_00350 [Bacteroidales bacterium]|jgi:hypothetical protein|nr:hypothetical protein [Bacteroidales bacterium]